jgi:thiol-disulfide isomerase/thioredoxin
MLHIHFLFLSFLISASFHGFSQEKTGIQFNHGTFGELKQQAARENKLIFIDAFTTWCGPCKWMAKNTFTDPEVATFFTKNFVNAKIDMEKGEGIELANRFGVQAYPTLLFLNPEGEVIHRSVGARAPKEFIDLGKEALEPESNLAGLKKKFQSDPSRFSVAHAYMGILKDAGLPEQKEVFDAYFATQPKESWIEQANWRMLFDYVQNPENPVFQNFKANRDVFSKRYSADSVNKKLESVYFGQLYNAAGNQEKTLWENTKSEILSLGLKGADRFIASTKIALAGDDNELVLREIYSFVSTFGSEDPGELNEFAWRTFETSKQPAQLQAAESWAKKAVSLDPQNSMILDTYANLLFKNGKRAQAKVEAEKAISLGKKAGADVSGTEELLAKINAQMEAVNKGKSKAKKK